MYCNRYRKIQNMAMKNHLEMLQQPGLDLIVECQDLKRCHPHMQYIHCCDFYFCKIEKYKIVTKQKEYTYFLMVFYYSLQELVEYSSVWLIGFQVLCKIAQFVGGDPNTLLPIVYHVPDSFLNRNIKTIHQRMKIILIFQTYKFHTG